MPTVITDPTRLASAQASFTETIRTALPQRVICTVSGADGGFRTEMAYLPGLSLWYVMQRQNKKCWNGFDVGEPLDGKKMSIVAKIDLPAEGLNRVVSGVFAEDGKGGLQVLHRGKIHDGKELSFRYFGGETVAANDGGREDTFALVGRLDDADFAAKLAAFVPEVLRIKAAAKG